MPTFNFNVKIDTSSKKKAEVEVIATTVNEKYMRFQNGLEISNYALASILAKLIETNLNNAR